MMSQITNNSTLSSIYCSAQNKENIKAPNYRASICLMRFVFCVTMAHFWPLIQCLQGHAYWGCKRQDSPFHHCPHQVSQHLINIKMLISIYSVCSARYTPVRNSAQMTVQLKFSRSGSGSWFCRKDIYREISNIRRTKSQTINDSHLVLKSPLPNPLKLGVKSRMKIELEQRRQAMLQLHLSDRQFNCPPMCVLY